MTLIVTSVSGFRSARQNIFRQLPNNAADIDPERRERLGSELATIRVLKQRANLMYGLMLIPTMMQRDAD
jgi:hypothetical protein